MEMDVLIFANGDEPAEGWGWVNRYLSAGQILIAADGGARHLSKLNLLPNVVVGDLDSMNGASAEEMSGQDIAFVHSPMDKDESDLELALIYAAQNFEGRILVFGATGGRFDQTISNALLLSHQALRGREVILIEPHQRAWLVDDEAVIQGSKGDLVSLLPIWGGVKVKRTSGLKWSLREEWLHPGPARGISNVMTGSLVTVEIDSGHLLCVHTDGDWNR